MKRALIAVLACWSAGLVFGDIVVPGGEGNSGGSTIHQTNARTYGEFISASQFAGLTEPVMFTGMQIRLATTGTPGSNWPSADVVFSQYDIQLSQASSALSLSGGDWTSIVTFADAQGSGLTTVRSGALTVPAGSYLYDGGITPGEPNSFTFSIAFTTPFLYTPGTDLTLLIRHSGSGVATPAFEAQIANFGVATGAFSTAGSGATTPTTANTIAFLVNFQGDFAVPEPKTYGVILTGLALLAAIGLLGRRRRRSLTEA